MSTIFNMGEQNFIVATCCNFAMTLYFTIRTIVRKHRGNDKRIDYGACDVAIYITDALFGTFGTYVVIWIRKELLLENIKNKRESENWKALLMMLKEAVVVCGRNSQILFANSALHDCIAREGKQLSRSADQLGSHDTISVISESLMSDVLLFISLIGRHLPPRLHHSHQDWTMSHRLRFLRLIDNHI